MVSSSIASLSTSIAQQQLKMVGKDEGNPIFPVAEIKIEPNEEEDESGPSGAGQEEEETGPTPSYPQAE